MLRASFYQFSFPIIFFVKHVYYLNDTVKLLSLISEIRYIRPARNCSLSTSMGEIGEMSE